MIGTSTNYYALVFEFMRKHKQFASRYPHDIPEEVRELRKRLLREELEELIEAMDAGNIYLIADGIADLLYVAFGAAITYGLPIDSIFTEVHLSNMTKDRLAHIPGIAHKVSKGLSFRSPKIRPIIDAYIEAGRKDDNNNSER